MERGQTTLDFAIGVSIFLISIAFVFTFVPGTLQPFTQGAQDETAGTDRVADLIVLDLTTEPGDAYILDGNCMAALLSDGAGTGCGFDGATLSARLDLPPRQSINVTVRGDPSGSGPELLCWDESKKDVVGVSGSCDVSDGDVRLVTGDSLPQQRTSVVTARRVVTIEGTLATVAVRMW